MLRTYFGKNWTSRPKSGRKWTEEEGWKTSFNQRSNLTMHYKIIHKVKKSKKCDICSAFITTNQHLNSYLQWKSSRGENEEKRRNVLFVMWSLKQNQHLNSHISSVQKSFSCSVCEFNSSCKQSLHQHVMKVHENSRPIVDSFQT